MKKIYFSLIVCCIAVISTFAQSPCQISLTSAVGTDAQAVCVNTAITVITYSVSGTQTIISPSLPAGLTGSYSAGVYTLSGTPTASGTYNYTITTTIGCSPNSSAAGSITVNPLPTASAPGSSTICQYATATISGASASNGSILWTDNGVGSLNNANTLTPTYQPVGGDAGNTVTLLMTVTSTNSCAGATATANYYINVDGVPIASAYTGPHTICEDASYTLQNGEASQRYGSPTWTENGTGSITNGVNSLTPTYQAAAGDAGNTVTLLMTVTSTNSCIGGGTATATYFINVDALPTAIGAPGSSTICQNATATISGASASNGSILWTENGTGSITNGGNTLTPTYTAAPGDAGMAVTLTMTVTSTNTCYPALAYAVDTVNVDNCSQSPCQISLTSAIGTDAQAICLNTSITPITYSVSGTSALITGLPSGLNGSYSAGIFTISGTPTVSGTYNYTIATTGSCLQVSTIGKITVGLGLTSPIGSDSQSVCLNTSIQNITYSIVGSGASVTGLPAGVTSAYNGGILTISGNPSVSGAYHYTVTTYGFCFPQSSLCGVITSGLELTSPLGSDSQSVCLNTPIQNITYSLVGGGASVTGLPVGVTYAYNGGILTISGNPSVSGDYHYTVTTMGTCQIQSNISGIITVNPNPITSILTTNETTSTACNGYLEAVAKGGVTPYTYVWSDSAAVNSAYRYKQCSGTYSVTVTDHAGCSATAAAYVGNNGVTTTTINPLSITATSTDVTDNALCNGAAVATVTGGSPTYSITFAGTTTTGSVLTISNLCAGFYTVNVKDAQNNMASFTFAVGSPATTHTIAPNPVYKDSTVAGTLITNAIANCIINYNAIDSLKITSLSLIGTDSINATWTIYQGSTINTQKAKYPFTVSGVYKLILNLFCTNRTSGSAKGIDEVYITNRSTSIAEIGANTISVYPNPTTGIIYLQGQLENAQIKICDVLGNTVYQNSGAPSNLQIDLSAQPNGIYFMSIQTGGGIVNKKIVVSR